MRAIPAWLLLAAFPLAQPLGAQDRKLTAEERIELIRGLTQNPPRPRPSCPARRSPST